MNSTIHGRRRFTTYVHGGFLTTETAWPLPKLIICRLTLLKTAQRSLITTCMQNSLTHHRCRPRMFIRFFCITSYCSIHSQNSIGSQFSWKSEVQVQTLTFRVMHTETPLSRFILYCPVHVIKSFSSSLSFQVPTLIVFSVTTFFVCSCRDYFETSWITLFFLYI